MGNTQSAAGHCRSRKPKLSAKPRTKRSQSILEGRARKKRTSQTASQRDADLEILDILKLDSRTSGRSGGKKRSKVDSKMDSKTSSKSKNSKKRTRTDRKRKGKGVQSTRPVHSVQTVQSKEVPLLKPPVSPQLESMDSVVSPISPGSGGQRVMPISPVPIDVDTNYEYTMHSFLRPSTATDLKDYDFAAHSSPKKERLSISTTPTIREHGFYVLYSPKATKGGSKRRKARSLQIESKRGHCKRRTLPAVSAKVRVH